MSLLHPAQPQAPSRPPGTRYLPPDPCKSLMLSCLSTTSSVFAYFLLTCQHHQSLSAAPSLRLPCPPSKGLETRWKTAKDDNIGMTVVDIDGGMSDGGWRRRQGGFDDAARQQTDL